MVAGNKSMQWFRMYAEALDDPKIQRLPADLFKVWVNLLCLAAKHDGVLPPREDIAFALRLSDEDAGAALFDLSQRGLLDIEDDSARPHNWNGRQYKSDVSTDRVKRHRQRSVKQDETVSVTPPEAETESDTETVPNGTGAKPPTDPRWDSVRGWLVDKGLSLKEARDMVGKWLKGRDREDVLRTLQEARIADPQGNVIEYVEGVLRNGGRPPWEAKQLAAVQNDRVETAKAIEELKARYAQAS